MIDVQKLVLFQDANHGKDVTITRILEEITWQICDDYCKWPELVQSEEELYRRYCERCPLLRLF